MRRLHLNCVPFSTDTSATLSRDMLLQLARMAEEGGFDALIFADMGGTLVSSGRSLLDLDPLLACSALAAVTRHIGLIASVSPLTVQPYNLARRFAALDHISGGRSAWHIPARLTAQEVMTYSETSCPSDAWPALTSEFISVAKQLWHSWSADAIVVQPDGCSAVDGSVNQPIAHQGRFFAVKGPLDIPRPPQGYPLIAMDIDTDDTLDLALADADILFPRCPDLAAVKTFRHWVNKRAGQKKRPLNSFCLMPAILPLVSDSYAEGQRRAARYSAAGYTVVTGTAAQVVDTLEQLFVSGTADGFNLLIPATCAAIHEVNQQLISQLCARGLFRMEYCGTTLRERY